MRMKALSAVAVAAVGLVAGSGTHATTAQDEPAKSEVLTTMNAALRAAGTTNVRIAKAEFLAAGGAYANQATTVIASDRTHLIPVQFVENDPRRPSPPNTITYLVDRSDGVALSIQNGAVVVLPNGTTEPEIDQSMAVWGAMPCNGPAIAKLPDDGSDPDWVDGLIAGNPALIGRPFAADVVHAGWLPAAFFNALVPQGAQFILGVTLTLTFIDDDGNETDIDRDGRADVAWQEIYYNRAFPWGTRGSDFNVDIQSVVIHEAGHALGLGHFGRIFVKADGALQFAPKAIMNAAYVSEDRRILGTDNASFCQAWARSH